MFKKSKNPNVFDVGKNYDFYIENVSILTF